MLIEVVEDAKPTLPYVLLAMLALAIMVEIDGNH